MRCARPAPSSQKALPFQRAWPCCSCSSIRCGTKAVVRAALHYERPPPCRRVAAIHCRQEGLPRPSRRLRQLQRHPEAHCQGKVGTLPYKLPDSGVCLCHAAALLREAIRASLLNRHTFEGRSSRLAAPERSWASRGVRGAACAAQPTTGRRREGGASCRRDTAQTPCTSAFCLQLSSQLQLCSLDESMCTMGRPQHTAAWLQPPARRAPRQRGLRQTVAWPACFHHKATKRGS